MYRRPFAAYRVSGSIPCRSRAGLSGQLVDEPSLYLPCEFSQDKDRLRPLQDDREMALDLDLPLENTLDRIELLPDDLLPSTIRCSQDEDGALHQCAARSEGRANPLPLPALESDVESFAEAGISVGFDDESHRALPPSTASFERGALIGQSNPSLDPVLAWKDWHGTPTAYAQRACRREEKPAVGV